MSGHCRINADSDREAMRSIRPIFVALNSFSAEESALYTCTVSWMQNWMKVWSLAFLCHSVRVNVFGISIDTQAPSGVKSPMNRVICIWYQQTLPHREAFRTLTCWVIPSRFLNFSDHTWEHLNDMSPNSAPIAFAFVSKTQSVNVALLDSIFIIQT